VCGAALAEIPEEGVLAITSGGESACDYIWQDDQVVEAQGPCQGFRVLGASIEFGSVPIDVKGPWHCSVRLSPGRVLGVYEVRIQVSMYLLFIFTVSATVRIEELKPTVPGPEIFPGVI